MILYCINGRFYILDGSFKLGYKEELKLCRFSTFIAKKVEKHYVFFKNRYNGCNLWFENISNVMEYIQFVDASSQRHKGAIHLSSKEDIEFLIKNF